MIDGPRCIRWWQFLLRYRCPHVIVRCTHGDEIIARRFSRRVCVECGKGLDGPLPEICAQTGTFHFRGEL